MKFVETKQKTSSLSSMPKSTFQLLKSRTGSLFDSHTDDDTTEKKKKKEEEMNQKNWRKNEQRENKENKDEAVGLLDTAK